MTILGSVPANGIDDAHIRQSGALSVIGRSANSTGNTADIAATPASGNVLRESGSALGFGQITTAQLSDYAEGTWTPTYVFGTSGSVTYTTQSGRYTRIGRLVFVEFEIVVNVASSPLGNVTISGLPFAVNGSLFGTGPCYASALTGLSGATPFVLAQSGSSVLGVYYGSVSGLQGTQVASGSTLLGGVTYTK
jgi:hypothetical protein